MVRSRSSFEATAEEWRFQDEARHEYSSKVSRPCNFPAPQNHRLTVSHSQGPELLRALCMASGTTEMRSRSGLTAKYGALRKKRAVRTDTRDLGATPPRWRAYVLNHTLVVCSLRRPSRTTGTITPRRLSLFRSLERILDFSTVDLMKCKLYGGSCNEIMAKNCFSRLAV